MAHKTLIGDTAYEIGGGKNLVGGTAYAIDKGKTLVGGTAYEVGFSNMAVVTITNSGTYGDTVAQVEINGTDYTAGQTAVLEVPVGTEIVCRANRGYSSGGIYVNGTRVSTDTYTYTVAGNITIDMYTKYNYYSSEGFVKIYEE